MQISFVMLLFSDQISGRGNNFQGGKLPPGASLPPLWKKASLIACMQAEVVSTRVQKLPQLRPLAEVT